MRLSLAQVLKNISEQEGELFADKVLSAMSKEEDRVKSFDIKPPTQQEPLSPPIGEDGREPIDSFETYAMVPSNGKKYYLARGDKARVLYEETQGEQAIPAGKDNNGEILYWTTVTPRNDTIGLDFKKNVIDKFEDGGIREHGTDIDGRSFSSVYRDIKNQGLKEPNEKLLAEVRSLR